MMGKKINLSVYAGHIFEHFDNFLYGFFAVQLAPVFFPSMSEFASHLSAFAAFAAGFLMRPLGALVFGYIGDLYGRKKALLITMMLVGIPTAGIGLLPDYSTIGYWSPILLVVCRLLQGLCLGGEYSGASIFIAEHANEKDVTFLTSLLISSGVLGVIIGTAIGAVVSYESMPEWAWRVPFLLGGIGTIIIYLMRRQIQETTVFVQQKKEKKGFPLMEVLKKHRFAFLTSMFVAGFPLTPLYAGTIFITSLFGKVGIDKSTGMLLNTGLFVFLGLVLVLLTRVFQKYPISLVMRRSALVIIFTSPVLFALLEDITFYRLLVFSMGCLAVSAAFGGAFTAYSAKLFPVSCRYSGLSLSLTVGQALIGGTTPFILKYLTGVTGSFIAGAYWVSGVGAICWMLMETMEKKRSKPLPSSSCSVSP